VAVAALDGRIYVAGGFDAAGDPTAVVEVFDAAAGSWSAAAPLPAPLHHMSLVAAAGRLWAVGGLSGGSFTPVATLHAYDPAADAWTRHADLPRSRGAMGTAEIGGRIYAVGGQAPGEVAVGDLAIYDPAADAWTAGAPMPTPREHLAAAAVGGRLYAAGGRRGSLASNRGTLEVYDPAADAWTQLPAMPTPGAASPPPGWTAASTCSAGSLPPRPSPRTRRSTSRPAPGRPWSRCPPRGTASERRR
jgi:hypothetical protein